MIYVMLLEGLITIHNTNYKELKEAVITVFVVYLHLFIYFLLKK